MITDDDVIRFFQGRLAVSGVYGGPGSLQIFRGPRHLRDAPLGGCKRHKTVFNQFGAIPEYCFDCYKVLITPHTVMGLFKLLMVFERLDLPSNNTRKCMVEGRPKHAGTYKGYVYCRSIEEGGEVLKILQEAVAVDISPHVPVTLERGCSEFARVYPEYAQIRSKAEIMKYPEAWKVHEDFVDDLFAGMPESVAGPSGTDEPYAPWEIFAMQYWLSYAATIGDVSYLKIAGRTVPLVPQLKRPPFAPPECK